MARSDPRQSGFSLTQLLIYVGLAAVLAAAAASTVVSNVRTASGLEQGQRAVDLFSRLNFFLQSEVAEGERISYGSAIPLPAGCGGGPGGTSQQLFTITVPFLISGIPAAPPAFIHYYTRNNGTELWRCGPSIDQRGNLVFSTTQGVATTAFDARVSNRTVLNLLDTNDPQSISYSLSFLSPGNQVILQRGSSQAPLVARTGVRLIQ